MRQISAASRKEKLNPERSWLSGIWAYFEGASVSGVGFRGLGFRGLGFRDVVYPLTQQLYTY